MEIFESEKSIKTIRELVGANGSVNFKAVNLSDKTVVETLSFLDSQDQSAELAGLMGYQRLLRLTDCEQSSMALFDKGLHSVFQLTEMALSTFVARHSDDCAVSDGESAQCKARTIYQKAVARKSQLVQTYIGIAQHNSAFYKAGRFDNVSAGTAQNFNGVPSYESQFGGLDFCTCPECRTIFSPAAYFVDLMSTQEKYIISETDSTKVGGILSLHTRRPDLWTTELSCKNTTTLISTVAIVNEVLAKSVAACGTNLSRGYQELSTAVYPFNLPYNLPLTQINTCLTKQDLGLAELWQTLTPQKRLEDSADIKNSIYLAELGISPEKWELYSDKSDKPVYDWYGLDENYVNNLGSVATFLEQTGLSYIQLRELLYQGLSDDQFKDHDYKTPKDFFINTGTEKPIKISDDREKLENLTKDRTNHINRFVRLAQSLNWSFPDLDWALATAATLLGEDKDTILDGDQALPALSWIASVRKQHSGWSMEKVCAIIGTLKTVGTADKPSFLGQVFFNDNVPNHETFENDNGGCNNCQWAIPSSDPALSELDSDSYKIQNALVAALNWNVDDLLLVARAIVEVNNDTDVLALNLENLSTLYRCSQLKMLTGLTLNENFTALTFTEGSVDAILKISDSNQNLLGSLQWLRDYAIWIQRSPFNTYQLEYLLTGGSRSPAINNQIITESDVDNFYTDFQQTITETLLTNQSLSQGLGDILLNNQYSEQAQEYVYNKLEGIGGTTKGNINSAVNDIFPSVVDDTLLTAQSYQLTSGLSQYTNSGDLGTKEEFVNKTKSLFYSAMDSGYLEGALSTMLTDESFVNKLESTEYFLVENPVDVGHLKDKLCPLLFMGKEILGNTVYQPMLTSLAEGVTSILNGAYESQQVTFCDGVSSLFDLESEVFLPVLQYVPVYPDQNNPPSFTPLTLPILIGTDDNTPIDDNAPIDKLLQALQNLQVYAVLIKSLELSAVEISSVVENLKLYGINTKNSDSPFFLSLANIQSLLTFKNMQLQLQDNQGLLVGYLNECLANKDVAMAAEKLHAITQWDQNQLQFLITNLWVVVADEDTPKPWATVDGLWTLCQWFDKSRILGLDVSTLWMVNNLSSSTSDYKGTTQVADALWAGMAQSCDEAELNALKINVDIMTRNALAPYALHTLNEKFSADSLLKGAQLTNYRDLSNYLLIDVEVGAEVETSRIGSAISTLQLYVHRCLNNLERDIKVQSEFEQWWQWMANYRVWEANRKVFLFPENYIEPELRTDKTPQFEQMETDLQAANLNNPADVEAVFNSYMDGFAKVADLEIVGSAGYDYVPESNPDSGGESGNSMGLLLDEATKVFCLIGRSQAEPYAYYYRTVTFAVDTTVDAHPYVPVKWDPWQEINIPIQAIGPVKPVFGLGKWFITWVEQQQTGSKKDKNDEQVPTYTSFCKLSYLNFNQEWVAPVVIGNVKNTPQLSNSAKYLPYWDQVYPTYFNSIQLLVMTFGREGSDFGVHEFQYGAAGLEEGLNLASRYTFANQAFPSPTNQLVSNTFDYECFSGGLPNSIDAALNDPKDSNTVYFFKGDLVYTCKWKERDILGLPRKIAEVFDGIEKITGAANVNQINTFSGLPFPFAYLFCGDKCCLYDWVNKKKIRDMEPVNTFNTDPFNLTDVVTPIKAAINLYKSHYPHIYIFNDKNYSKLTENGEVKSTNDISEGFNGIHNGIDAAIQDPSDSKIGYFFKGDQCVSFDNDTNDHKDEGNILDEFNHALIVQADIDTIDAPEVLYFSTWCFPTSQCQELFRYRLGEEGDWKEIKLPSEGAINAWCYCSISIITNDNNKKIEYKVNGVSHIVDESFKEQNIITIELVFDGVMQEVLMYENPNEISSDEIYNNSKQYITRGYENIVDSIPCVNTALEVGVHPNRIVVDQPGWQTYDDKGIQLLTGLQKKDTATDLYAYRLNTTAVKALSQNLYMQGVGGLLSVPSQQETELPWALLKGIKLDIPVLHDLLNNNSDQINFMGGAMSQYYWEIFFYMPFLIAKSLQTQQLNEAAQTWYEYIFNPTINNESADIKTDESDNDKYWRFIALRSGNTPLLKTELNESWAEEVKNDTAGTKLDSKAQLYAYHNNPFDPHAIARLRPIAYQKTMVMHYIDNLLNWGDKLFRQYTVESIVEANMLYMMAYDLLGKDPLNLGEMPLPAPSTFTELLNDKDKDNSFLIYLEQNLGVNGLALNAQDSPINYIPNLYFGLPENEEFMRYWDTVKERLYDIRQGLNIDGVRQHLDLFQPAIDPAKLVEQLGNGGSVGQALAVLQTNIPFYRFSVMIQLAKNTCQAVMQFGQSLLAVLEKKDAEQLSRMYNQNQLNLLQQTTGSKQAQVDALEETLESLKFSKNSAEERYEYYSGLIDKGLSGEEEAQLGQMMSATASLIAANIPKPLIPIADSLPNVVGFAVGGMKYSAAPRTFSSIANTVSSVLSQTASITGTYASYDRREQDWKLQKTLAESDKEQINHQIESTQYQIQAAEGEVDLLKKNINQEQSTQQFLKNKFTNEQLYQWMKGKLSAQYFQSYQLAYEQSLQAQQAWHFEKGVEQSFVNGGYWNDLYEGLLAGENLLANLMQMENAFMQQNKRRLEISKTISLAQIDRVALQSLIKKGECIFSLDEALFDKDYPGHYCRQIVSVSITLPTLIGPYQNIHATLTQLRNSVRLKSSLNDNVTKRVDWQTNQQIALSQGINDTGMFTLNFGDERYLPFEGTGAESIWKLELNKQDNPDIVSDNLTDVIIQINYSALQGSLSFAGEVREKLKTLASQS
jgi:hypothetical protein